MRWIGFNRGICTVGRVTWRYKKRRICCSSVFLILNVTCVISLVKILTYCGILSLIGLLRRVGAINSNQTCVTTWRTILRWTNVQGLRTIYVTASIILTSILRLTWIYADRLIRCWVCLLCKIISEWRILTISRIYSRNYFVRIIFGIVWLCLRCVNALWHI